MLCETKVIALNELYDQCKSGRIIKPQIQRSVCWDFKPNPAKKRTNVYDFIRFLVDTRNAVNPLIVVKRYYEGAEKLVLIDGNNRMNAVMNFLDAPLELLDELLSDDFTQESKNIMKSVSLKDIMDRSLNDLFEKSNNKHVIKKNYEIATKKVLRDEYTKIKECLREMDIQNVKFPITEFSSVTETEMVKLYEGLNKTGVDLSEQDILASTTSFHIYMPGEIENYDTLREIIDEYYNDVNSNEVLEIKVERDHMNLYQILMAFKILSVRTFEKVIKPANTKVIGLEFMFQWYKQIFGGFNEAISAEELNGFMARTTEILQFLDDVYARMFITDLWNIANKSDYDIKLKKTMITLIFIYLYKNMSDERKIIIEACIYYHEILSCFPIGAKTRADENISIFKAKHPLNMILEDHKGAKIRSLSLESEIDIEMPDYEMFEEMIYYCLSSHLKPAIRAPMRRKKPARIKIILMSNYFRTMVPHSMLNRKKDVEHIIPFSSKFPLKDKKGMDIDRLGNITMIDRKINNARGDARITDDFIKKNNLKYMLYPSEDEYNEIVSDTKKIFSIEKYNNMCEKREKEYVDALINFLF